MKQKQNRWFVTAFILLGIGLGLMSLARQLSGNRISIKNGFTHLFEDDRKEDGSHYISETITFDQKQSASVKSIAVDCAVGTVSICEWDRDYLEGTIYSDEEALEPAVMLENGCLKLTITAKHGFTVNFTGFDSDRNAKAGITLYVPKGMTLEHFGAEMDAGTVETSSAFVLEGSFFAEVNAGQLIVRNISAELIDCHINAGQLILSDASCQQVRASANAGQLKIENLKSEQSTFEVNAGEGKVEGCFLNRTELSVNAGSLDFTNALSLDQTAVQLDIEAGSATINNQKYSGLDKKLTLGEHSGNLLVVEVGTGTVKIHYQDE